MTEPTILPGCSVLPPMEPPRPRTTSNNSKAEKPKRKKQTAERFGVINAFVDFTLGSLTRNEMAVWLVLWRTFTTGNKPSFSFKPNSVKRPLSAW